MTAYTGKNMYLAFKGTAIQADYRSFEPSGEIGAEDASAGSDAARTYLTTLTDGNASLTMRTIAGTAGTAFWNHANFALGAEGTLEWGPQGTATSSRRTYVNAILTSKSESNAYASVAEWTMQWQYSGAITNTVY